MRYVLQLFQYRFQQVRPTWNLVEFLRSLPDSVLNTLHRVKRIGVTPGMDAMEKSKLVIFNYLNFFQFITGILVPVIGFFYTERLPAIAWVMAILPAVVSITVLVLNSYKQYRNALLTYFVFYPFIICLGYINGVNLGVELSFVLYGILSVFFIRDIGYMVFSISFSMISYFVLSVILKKYPYQLEHINFIIYLVNQALAIIYIFYGLYLIKTENSNANAALHAKNIEVQEQANLLKEQTEQLHQVNALKSKLFSVISHDLKAPMYALRNLFDNIQSQDLPAEEVKEMIPDIKKDLNYTVSLMENLLQWAKSQMAAHSAKPALIHVKEMIDEVVHLLHLQSDAKQIVIENKAPNRSFAWADEDMIKLVMRNLVTNAIKFTPIGGKISVGSQEIESFTEIYVQDSGKGISRQELAKIKSGDEFYTTNGTAQEQGTGLGLLLCKEFLAKNDSQLRIETEPGRGSTFSFALANAE